MLVVIAQVLLKESVVGSDLHTCNSCQHLTRKCTSCSDGFAWGNGIMNSFHCAVCVGSVRSWLKLEAPAISEVSAICSWCLQKSVHQLIEKNSLRRSVCVFVAHVCIVSKHRLPGHRYCCTICHGRTLKCTLCRDYMARGGSNYDNKLCLQCDPFPSLAPSLVASARKFTSATLSVDSKSGVFKTPNNAPNIATPTPAQHMANVIEHLSTPWAIEDAHRALNRESAFRAAARSCGVIRPFLLLVSMSVAARVRIAAMMGISLVTSHSFGDEHAESWVILHSPFIGMQWNRGGGQLSSSGTWYDILRAMQGFTQQAASIPLKAAASLSLSQCANDALAEMEISILSSLHVASLQHLSEDVAQRAAVLRVVSEVIQAVGGDPKQASVVQAGLPRAVLNALAVLAPPDANDGKSQSFQEKLEIVSLFHASVLHAMQRKGMDISDLALDGMAAAATDAYCREILSSGQYTLLQDLWQDCSSGEVAAQGGAFLGVLVGGPLAVAGVAWLDSRFYLAREP
jgi:hypothetical protein